MSRLGTRRAVLVALAVGCVALASCKPHGEAPTGPRPTRVLFIGNSYTYYNNLPRMLEALAASASPPLPVETRAVVVGGAQLKTHWDDGKALKVLREGGWDYVVLQEQSTLGGLLVDGRLEINDPERVFFPYARKFDSEVRRQGAKTLLSLTWSRQWAPEAQVRLNHAFFSLGRELGATVVPMGPAWLTVREQHPEVSLYVADGSHPNPAGTYLAACTLYATLFGRSPEGLTSTVRGVPTPDGKPRGGETTLVSLPEPTARLLQQTAWKTVEALKAHGDTVEPLPPRTLPSLPSGVGMRWDSLPGVWKGELRFYPEQMGLSPAALRLELKPDGDGYDGVLRITFEDGRSDGPFEVRAERTPEGTLRFTSPFGQGEPGEVRYDAVMSGDGKLVGTAVQEDRDTLDRMLGSWRLERAR
ncbi:SGNH/GDSL hydrolase family protein [Pyxidicoccus parkwayensis]|uniref:SGNH/GDSL hydrolase family protein n=1 Tax=Pyxidicoccus parkwayensis TaxID=2813578 RepID=A0ABX7NX38_9BACT|nr:SGNH/GDSL hydrolase family protein [Pyxidicoccus parkwaysis]QSQ23023.1 SGNH/GDSL hydrolase family protein [Pyxidicoccus parkwaysis]